MSSDASRRISTFVFDIASVNGLAPFNPFFHGVACEFVKCELDSIGLDCDFVPLQVDQSAHDDKPWDGVRRRYWRFDAYHLPLASHKTT